ncbi:MAG: glucose 1-dehydrogenase [Anaerolineaceae bacterium]|nr:MAG: glucose 1-dehydrogenase [Anaerolineaceae bacterium]
MKRFEGQVAIVTGGARGLGEKMCEKFALEGASVVLSDILEDEAKQTADRIRGNGCEITTFVSDLREIENIRKLIQYTVYTYGRLDILVNNAGVNRLMPAVEMTEETFDWILDVDLRTPFFCSVEAAKVMMRQKSGKIVNISSGNSRMMNIGRAPYCIAKAGINAMTSILAAEWAIQGIRVNAVAPGWIKTAIPSHALKVGLLNEEQVLSISPVQRWGKEEEIANVVCFLASDDASYIIGQTVFADGGWSTGILPHALDYFKEAK